MKTAAGLEGQTRRRSSEKGFHSRHMRLPAFLRVTSTSQIHAGLPV